METRLEKILACIDVRTETGLEVGALVSPIVTPDMGNIRYIDHATTEELQAKYAHDPNVDIHKIVKVDYVWGKEGLPELVGQDAPFDYLVASHVIEHVPDFIGWLKEVHAVLKVGGTLSLVIPDKRYCFDYYRRPTLVADVVDAFLHHARKPSPRQVFDYMTSAVMYNGSIAWDSAIPIDPHQLKPMYSELEAWQFAQRSLLENQYIDAHCWVFTPQSFFNLLRSLIHLELLGFKVEKFHETAGCEFYVSLKALDLNAITVSDRQALQLASLPVDLEDSAPTTVQLSPALPPMIEPLLSPQQIIQLQRKKERQAIKIQRLTLRLAETRQQLSDLQNSQSWKLTAPLRWLRNRALKSS
jgi:SAM-dependent methyltransferase